MAWGGARQVACEQGENKIGAGSKACAGLLGQGFGHDRPVGLRQRVQVRFRRGVLQQKLPQVIAAEWQAAGQEFLINNGQTVLIAMGAE